MLLTQTKRFIQEKIQEGQFDTYAVVAGINGSSCLITSENANRDTYFDIASTGKVLVTSTLALKTIGSGKLELSDTLGKFYPDAPQDKKDITVQQLLTHTIGLTQTMVPKEIGEQGSDAVAAHVMASPLLFQPGTDYTYSSDGLTLMGFILEKIYGMPLDEIYYKYLTEPLGLTRSRFNIALDEDNAAVCYSDNIENRVNRADDDVVYNMKNCVCGGGGSFSSAGDIEKFILAVLKKDERLYPKYLFDLAERDYTPDFSLGRGLGYWLGDAKRYPEGVELFPQDSLTFGHIGSTGESFYINRKNEMYVIILTNYCRYSGYRTAHDGVFLPYDEYMNRFFALRQEIYRAIKEDLTAQNIG